MSEWEGLAYGSDASTGNILDVAPQGVAGVSGSFDARTDRDRGSDVEPRCLNHGPKSAMTVQASCQASESVSEALSQVSSGEPISPADSQISAEGGYGYNPPVHDGLTLERLIDSVVRAEEHAPAQDEGDENDSPSDEEIDYLLGGYNDPQYERNGR